MAIDDKGDVVRGLRGRHGALIAHVSAEEIDAAYESWKAAGKPCALLDWLRQTFRRDAA